MRCCTWSKLKTGFKFSCVVATFVMIGFWFYEFSIDDDLCLVDYESFGKSKDVSHPLVSMCFVDPIDSKKLVQIDTSLNTSTYIAFLRGDVFDEKWIHIDYDNVTMALSEYVLGYAMKSKNRPILYYEKLDNIIFKEPKVTYSGFTRVGLTKCYSTQISDEYIADLQFFATAYKQDVFPDGIRPSKYGFYVSFHYRDQFLLYSAGKNRKYTWPKYKNKPNYMMDFLITYIEVLQRRNKRNEPCLEEPNQFDKLLLEQYDSNIGCRPPYRTTHKNLPLCSTKETMKQHALFSEHSKYMIPPCKTMSNIQFTYEELLQDKWTNNETWMRNETWFYFTILTAAQSKIIRQEKAIDIQTLVGNAGGYIGLFLGYALIGLPEFLSMIFGRLNRFYLDWKASNNLRTGSRSTSVTGLEEHELETREIPVQQQLQTTNEEHINLEDEISPHRAQTADEISEALAQMRETMAETSETLAQLVRDNSTSQKRIDLIEEKRFTEESKHNTEKRIQSRIADLILDINDRNSRKINENLAQLMQGVDKKIDNLAQKMDEINGRQTRKIQEVENKLETMFQKIDYYDSIIGR